jgi:hypothetical protein
MAITPAMTYSIPPAYIRSSALQNAQSSAKKITTTAM